MIIEQPIIVLWLSSKCLIATVDIYTLCFVYEDFRVFTFADHWASSLSKFSRFSFDPSIEACILWRWKGLFIGRSTLSYLVAKILRCLLHTNTRTSLSNWCLSFKEFLKYVHIAIRKSWLWHLYWVDILNSVEAWHTPLKTSIYWVLRVLYK